MKIISVEAMNIHYISNLVRDAEGHSHPGKPHAPDCLHSEYSLLPLI